MPHPLFDADIDGRALRVVATDRGDGDVHPLNVSPRALAARQSAATPACQGWSMADQVHGVEVLDADEHDHWAPTLGTADVVVTRAPGAPVAVWAADCAPLVLAADDGTLVAAHAGWCGLAAGVIDAAVSAATLQGGTVVAAALGPVIHPCCYEFGSDDLDRIEGAVEARTSGGRLALDVPATISLLLARRGIALDVTGPCTGCDERWFSHRVRAEPARHAVVAWWDVIS